jgi:hypothetical protein
MSESKVFRHHGLTGSIKQRVFDVLFELQQGKCFICGISQAELKERCRERGGHALAPVHWKLHIDHCHATGMIRGLLCSPCNTSLAFFECAFQGNYLGMDVERTCWHSGKWIEENKEIVFRYMQKERWFPRKDILFHLQSRNRKADELAALVGIE